MTIERRMTPNGAAPVSLENRLDDLPKITGLAAVYYDGTKRTEYELWPGVVERIMPGAFKRALDGQNDVRALSNHNPDNLLGRVSAGTLHLTDTDEGLQYTIDTPDTTVGRDITENIRLRNSQGSSFAFTVPKDGDDWHFEGEGESRVEVRELLALDTFDVGPVTYPAYDSTTTGLKSADGVDEARASHTAWKQRAADRARRAKALEVSTRVAEVEAI